MRCLDTGALPECAENAWQPQHMRKESFICFVLLFLRCRIKLKAHLRSRKRASGSYLGQYMLGSFETLGDEQCIELDIDDAACLTNAKRHALKSSHVARCCRQQFGPRCETFLGPLDRDAYLMY